MTWILIHYKPPRIEDRYKYRRKGMRIEREKMKQDRKTDRKKTNKEERKKERKQMSKQTKDKQPNQNRTHSPVPSSSTSRCWPPGCCSRIWSSPDPRQQPAPASWCRNPARQNKYQSSRRSIFCGRIMWNNNNCLKDCPYSCFLYIPYHTGPYSTTPKKTPHPNITIPHYTIPHHTTP